MGADSNIGATIGGYRIESLIGRGGMGAAYLAEHAHLERNVALKVLAADLAGDEDFRQRFVRESRLAAKLYHPNIIPIDDAGEAGGVLYIAMHYVEGTDRGAVLRERGPLDAAYALFLMERIGGALDEAHANGLVHRDVKPGNVMIGSGEGERQQVFLTDFGLVKSMDSRSHLTQTGYFVGTLNYAAPEMFRGEEVDGRADVYALGCVLYECLTGEIPFARENQAALITAHLFDPPPSVTEKRPELPAALDGVVARALEKDRDA